MSTDADFDVIVMGGSVAGLLAAREVAATGLSVSIFEEHSEIGLPEKCDGLVSTKAISSLGIVPKSRMVQNHIDGALLTGPRPKPPIRTRSGLQLTGFEIDRLVSSLL